MEKDSVEKKVYSSDEAHQFHKNIKLNYKFMDKVKYGVRHPDAVDEEHPPHMFFQARAPQKPLPEKVDLSEKVKEVYDQGDIGSCVANSVAMAYRYTVATYNSKSTFHYYAWNYNEINPSRLFLYFYNRVLEGTSTKLDSGSSVLSGFRSITEHGVCDEKFWPYNTAKFSKPPNRIASNKADLSHTPGYHKIRANLENMKHALANHQPISFGAVLFKSFYDKDVINNGIVSVPKKRVESVMGGHCLLIVGYDEEDKVFIIKNSWGEAWGKEGFCRMPYEYILDQDLCADFWSFCRI